MLACAQHTWLGGTLHGMVHAALNQMTGWHCALRMHVHSNCTVTARPPLASALSHLLCRCAPLADALRGLSVDFACLPAVLTACRTLCYTTLCSIRTLNTYRITVAPRLHLGQGGEPPQSTSVSLPFLTLSEQLHTDTIAQSSTPIGSSTQHAHQL